MKKQGVITANKLTKADLALDRLFELYPNTFRKHQPSPLKLGIHADLIHRIAVLGRPFTKRSILGALHKYTSRPAYQRALKLGRGRVDLEGTVTGDVTETEAAVASKRLERLLAEKAADKPAHKLTTVKAAKQKRDSSGSKAAIVIKKKRHLT